MLTSKLINKYKNLPVQVKASLWYFICSFLQKAVSALTTPIFTRLLTSSEYGQFNVFLSWQSILRVFITLNLFYGVFSAGLVKFKDRRSEFVSSFQGLTLLLIILWTIVYSCFRSYFNDVFSLTTPQMYSMLLMFWTTAVYSFWAAEQRVEYKYKTLAIITIVSTIAKPALGIILVLTAEDKVTARILGLLTVESICFSWMFFSQIKRYPHLFSSFFWKYAIKLNIPLVPHYLSQNILNNSDRIMIERMVSFSAAGIYSLAYSVSLIMNMFNSALLETIGPWVYERIKLREELEIKRLLIPSLYFIAGVNIILIALAPEVVKIFAPAEYYQARWIIPPVVMSVYYTYLYNLFSYFEFYFEKTSYIAVATMFAAVINLGLNYFFINSFGFIAAGYTTLICYILYAVGHYCVMKYIVKLNLDGNKVLPAIDLIKISVEFMIIGFVFCALYDIPIIRYVVFAVMVVILILSYNKWSIYVKELLNLRGFTKTN